MAQSMPPSAPGQVAPDEEAKSTTRTGNDPVPPSWLRCAKVTVLWQNVSWYWSEAGSL